MKYYLYNKIYNCFGKFDKKNPIHEDDFIYIYPAFEQEDRWFTYSEDEADSAKNYASCSDNWIILSEDEIAIKEIIE